MRVLIFFITAGLDKFCSLSKRNKRISIQCIVMYFQQLSYFNNILKILYMTLTTSATSWGQNFDINDLIAHCQFSGFLFIPFPLIFVVKNHATQFFFVKSQHSLLDFCHFAIFFPTWSWLLIFYDFKPNFLLEAGQTLERS